MESIFEGQAVPILAFNVKDHAPLFDWVGEGTLFEKWPYFAIFLNWMTFAGDQGDFFLSDFPFEF